MYAGWAHTKHYDEIKNRAVWLCLKSGPAKKTRPDWPGRILGWKARPGRILGNKYGLFEMLLGMEKSCKILKKSARMLININIRHDFHHLIVNADKNYGVAK